MDLPVTTTVHTVVRAAIVAAAIVAWVLLLAATTSAAPLDDVTVIGHRGNPFIEVENTLQSNLSAYRRGVRDVENDFGCTSSGTIVAAHDQRWENQSTGTGDVDARSWSYVKRQYAHSRPKYDATRPRAARRTGRRHPNLAQVLRQVEQLDLTLHVDYKTTRCTSKVLRVLQDAHDRGVKVVFGARTDAQRQRAVDTTTLALSSSDIVVPDAAVDTEREAEALVDAETAEEQPREPNRVIWLSVRWSSVTPELVDAAHAEGRKVRVWTFRPEDTPDQYASVREWIADLHAETGFDAIITDQADSRNHGIALP